MTDGWGIFGPERPRLIAGPCSAESEEQLMQTAAQLRKLGVEVLRAGLWKPRTHPGYFEGVGEEGLPWMQRVQRELGMKVCTEVAGAAHVRRCLEAGIDMFWIGARTTANPFMVQEIADALEGSCVPVLVKNPVNPDMELWFGAIERLQARGVSRIGAIFRGFSTTEVISYRNSPHWQMAARFRQRFPDMPLFCDPSHMSGDAAYVPEIARRALELGFDSLMIESHSNPDRALSDAAQQLSPAELGVLLESLKMRVDDVDDPDFRSEMARLRSCIDELDETLVSTLAKRMELSRRIGQAKKANNVSIIQTGRWDSMMSRVLELGRRQGLDGKFLSCIFNEIHEASISEQDKKD